jgi:hypothetical protein
VSAPVVVRIPNPGQTRRSAPTVHAIANRSSFIVGRYSFGTRAKCARRNNGRTFVGRIQGEWPHIGRQGNHSVWTYDSRASGLGLEPKKRNLLVCATCSEAKAEIGAVPFAGVEARKGWLDFERNRSKFERQARGEGCIRLTQSKVRCGSILLAKAAR